MKPSSSRSLAARAEGSKQAAQASVPLPSPRAESEMGPLRFPSPFNSPHERPFSPRAAQPLQTPTTSPFGPAALMIKQRSLLLPTEPSTAPSPAGAANASACTVGIRLEWAMTGAQERRLCPSISAPPVRAVAAAEAHDGAVAFCQPADDLKNVTSCPHRGMPKHLLGRVANYCSLRDVDRQLVKALVRAAVRGIGRRARKEAEDDRRAVRKLVLSIFGPYLWAARKEAAAAGDDVSGYTMLEKEPAPQAAASAVLTIMEKHGASLATRTRNVLMSEDSVVRTAAAIGAVADGELPAPPLIASAPMVGVVLAHVPAHRVPEATAALPSGKPDLTQFRCITVGSYAGCGCARPVVLGAASARLKRRGQLGRGQACRTGALRCALPFACCVRKEAQAGGEHEKAEGAQPRELENAQTCALAFDKCQDLASREICLAVKHFVRLCLVAVLLWHLMFL
jgi:hypothetical protein